MFGHVTLFATAVLTRNHNTFQIILFFFLRKSQQFISSVDRLILLLLPSHCGLFFRVHQRNRCGKLAKILKATIL